MIHKISAFFISFIGYASVPGVLIWVDIQAQSIFLIMLDFQFNSGEALLVWLNVLFIIFKIAEKVLSVFGIKIKFKFKK